MRLPCLHQSLPTPSGPHKRSFLALIALLGFISSCSDLTPIPGPAPTVTRGEAITIAKAYHELEWTPSEHNIKHGRDRNGIMVQTPDVGLAKHSHTSGWWKPGKTMVGMPYQWGGFDTPWQFLISLEGGEAAGDIATVEKRRLDDAGTSREACGIDCSGFVSRCWRLRRAYSTDELPQICTRVDSWTAIKPGDIFLKNGHVLLFCSWDPLRSGNVLAYEAAPYPKWRVNLGSIPVEDLKKVHYTPWRYRNIRD